jgi:hypothetical protein
MCISCAHSPVTYVLSTFQRLQTHILFCTSGPYNASIIWHLLKSYILCESLIWTLYLHDFSPINLFNVGSFHRLNNWTLRKHSKFFSLPYMSLIYFLSFFYNARDWTQSLVHNWESYFTELQSYYKWSHQYLEFILFPCWNFQIKSFFYCCSFTLF